MSPRVYRPALAVALLVLSTACGSGAPRSGEPTHDAQALVGAASPMSVGRSWAAGARLADGRVLVAGGFSDYHSAEIFDPVLGTWSPAGVLAGSWSYHEAVSLLDGRVLLACMQSGSSWTPVEVYAPVTGSWTTYGSYATRSYCRATRLDDGRVVITGGNDLGYKPEALVFDPATNGLATKGSLAIPRDSHAAVKLADGRVLVAGGRIASGTYTASVELFDPGSGTFSPGPGMAATRMSATATLLQDGRILVAGGKRSTGPDAEVFDPGAGTWTPTGPMVVSREMHSAVRLTDGRVVIVGGFPATGASYTATVEIFDPATNAFVAGEPLPFPRRNEVSVALADGRILVAGGITADPAGSASVLLYDVGNICTPTTCAAAGAQCGTIPDGCSGTLSCGGCAPGATCSAHTCVGCAPATCASAGAQCGGPPDGCGGTLSCGACPSGQSCVSYQCLCAPLSCGAQGIACGTASDGCGGTLACGGCAPGQSCVDHACVVAGGLAAFDPALGAPACSVIGPSCDSGALLLGRAQLGPESGAPNTIDVCLDGTGGTFHADESLDALRVATLDGSSLAAGAQVRVEADVWAWSGSGSDVLELFHARDAAAPQWTRVATLAPTKPGAQTLSAAFVLPVGGERQAIRAVFRYGGSSNPCPGGAYDDVDDLVFQVPPPPPDVVPPEVTLLAPADGALLGGAQIAQATAADDVGVARVEFYVDGMLLGSDSEPPYTASWDAAWFADGAHNVIAYAYDVAGNSRAAIARVTTDGTKPTVALTSPPSGATVSGTVMLTASASDASGVARVAFYDGATPLGTVMAPPWALAWSASGAGAHALTARATDGAGNVATSLPVTVTVAGAAPPGVAQYDAVRRAPACATVSSSCDSGSLLNGRALLGPEPNASNAIAGSCSDGTAGTYHGDESVDRIRVSTLDGSPLAAGKLVKVEATVWVWGAGSDRLDVWYTETAAAPAWKLAGTVAPTANGQQTLSQTFTLPSGSLQAVRAMFRYGGAATSPCVPGSFNDVDDLVFATQ